MSKSNFNWSSDFSIYSNKTEIVELYQGKVDDVGNQWFIGHPINVYYDYEKIGIWQMGEEADAAMFGETVGQIHVKDQNSDNKHNILTTGSFLVTLNRNSLPISVTV